MILCGTLLFPAFASAALPTGFEIETVTGGLYLPTALAFTSDGRMFIAQKDGTVRVYKNGALLPTPLLTLTDINNYGDRGLIGMAVDPNFATNGFLYLSYAFENTPGANYAGTKTGRIVRVTVVGDTASESSKVVLVGRIGGNSAAPSCQHFAVTDDCIPSDSSSHSMGGLRFGPDGKLYASLGDGSRFDAADINALRAQDIDSLSGKMLRINTDGTAPADNPFYNGNNTANRSKVYAYGFRNMFRFNFKPGTNMLFGGDVGWSTSEEINRIVPGGNYGWPCREGAVTTPGYTCVAPAAIEPLYSYGHNALGAASVTAGAFPSGSAYPLQYANTLFFGDFAQNWIKQMTVVNTTGALVSVGDFAAGEDGTNGPVDFVTGPEGNVYFIAIYEGEVKRITHTSGNRQPIVNVSATPMAGAMPLLVNFSSAGTHDPDADPLTYAWNFGDGATSAAANPSHTYSTPGEFHTILTVRDNRGGVQARSMLIHAGNRAPVAQIISPVPGSLYTPASALTLSGSGSDVEDGTLPASSFTWRVILHHNTHIHVLETRTGNPINISGPDHGDPSVFTEVELTVRDSTGLAHTTSINIYVNNGGGQSGNLIQNGSFETVDPLNADAPQNWSMDWWGNLAPIFTYPVQGYEGGTSRAAKVQITQYAIGDAKWTFSPAFVEGGTLLSFSDYYIADVQTTGVAEIGFTDGSHTYVNLGVIPPAATWTKWSTTFTTPPGSRYVGFFHLIESRGNLTVDNFSLLLGTSTTAVPPPNLLTNPSFETANGPVPLGWTPAGWGPNDRTFSYPVPGRTGAKAVQTKMVNYTDGDTKWMPDSVPVTAGTEYTYSDWYIADDISDIIGQYIMNDGSLVYFGVTKELPPTTTWRKASGNFIPPAGVSRVTFLHLVSSPATLTIDDASLTTSVGTYVDTEHPAVTLTQPFSGSTVTGSVTLAAAAIDNIGVASVQFFVDGTLLGSPDLVAPYGVVWDTRNVSNGTHTLAARARDAAGVSATSTLSVVVQNVASANPNLIANPSFEAGANPDGSGDPSSWQRGTWGTNNAVFTYPVAGQSTSRGAQLVITTYSDGDAKWYGTPVAVSPGQSYQFSNMYKSDAVTRVVARYTLSDGTFRYVDMGSVPLAANWTAFGKTLVAPTNATHVVVFHVLASVGTLTLDDYALTSLAGQPNPDLFPRGMVSLSFDDGWISHYTNVFPMLDAAGMKGSFELISLETLDALPYQRIANPSLESRDSDGKPIDWTTGSWGTHNAAFSYPVAGQDGASAARVSITNYASGDAKWFFNDSTVVDGADYAISDFYMSDVPTTITARYNMGNNVFVYADIATLPPSAVWTQFTRQLTIPANVESFTFFHHLNSIGTLTIDNASFSKVQIFVSPAQMLDMQKSGHGIGSHTRTHPSLTALPLTEMQSEVSASRSDLLGMGAQNVNVVVYPYGDYNGDVKAAAMSSGYIAGRSVDRGFNTRSTDKFTLKVQQVDMTTTVAQVRAWIDTAAQEKTWLVLMFHQVDASGKELATVTPNLQAIINYLASAQVSVVTLEQGVALMN